MRSAIARRVGALAVMGVMALAAPGAEAQRNPPGEGAHAWQDVRASRGEGVLLRTSWSARNAAGRRTSEVSLQRMNPDGTAVGPAVSVHRGALVLTSLALREGASLVTVVHGGEQAFVRLALMNLAPNTAPRVTTIDVPRPSDGGYRPSYAVACADPEGFTVFWQETVMGSPAADVRTYMARVRADGTWVQQPRVIAVPWGFGAAAWNGHGYHMALYYDGAREGQTRLNLVTLSAAGQPEQHPWWVTPAEAAGEVQLLSTPSEMALVYRGGADGTALRRVRSASVGSWGHEPAAPEALGAIAPDEAFALRLSDAGVVEVLRRAANVAAVRPRPRR